MSAWPSPLRLVGFDEPPAACGSAPCSDAGVLKRSLLTERLAATCVSSVERRFHAAADDGDSDSASESASEDDEEAPLPCRPAASRPIAIVITECV